MPFQVASQLNALAGTGLDRFGDSQLFILSIHNSYRLLIFEKIKFRQDIHSQEKHLLLWVKTTDLLSELVILCYI